MTTDLKAQSILTLADIRVPDILFPEQLAGFCSAVLLEISVDKRIPIQLRAPARLVGKYIKDTSKIIPSKSLKYRAMIDDSFTLAITNSWNAPVAAAFQVLLLICASHNNPTKSTKDLAMDGNWFGKFVFRAEAAGIDLEVIKAYATIYLT